MKNATKLLAVTTALCLTVGASLLAACGKNKEKEESASDFKISDYAKEYSSSYDHDGITKAERTDLTTDELRSLTGTTGVVIRTEASDGGNVYRLYNVKKQEYVTNKEYSIKPVSTFDGFVYQVYGENGSYFIDTAGNTLLPENSYTYLSYLRFNNVYVGDSQTAVTVFGLEYSCADSDEIKAVYLYPEYDEDGEHTGRMLETEKGRYSYVPAYEEYDSRDPIYSPSAEYEVEGEIAEYTYNVVGGVYKFYKGNDETGSLDLSDVRADALGFVGNYLYYLNWEMVTDSKSSYNFISQYGVKYNWTYYRYDILSGVSERYNPEYLILNFNSQFNYTTNTYDAAVVYAYDFFGGVANPSAERTMIINAEGEFVKDITNEVYSVPNRVYKLDDTHYYYSGYILDENFSVQTELGSSSVTIYPQAGLIRKSSGDYINFDGSLVFGAKFSYATINSSTGAYTSIQSRPLDFYGGAAVCVDRDATLGGSDELTLLMSDHSTISLNAYLQNENDSFAIYPTDGIFVVKTAVEDDVNYTYKIYNYYGELLNTVSGYSISPYTNNGDMYLAVASTEETVIYKLS